MKDNNEQPNFNSSTFTRTKNLFEAIRNGVKGKLSSENEYANCGCCTEKDYYANIDGVWSQEAYSFLKDAYTPDASYDSNGHLRIHPTLWNNGTNNLLSGVFEVIPEIIYQVRGYDMANITFVRSGVIKNDDGTFPKVDGNSRWIVLDTLMSNECTEAALKLFEGYLNKKYSDYTLGGKISAIIISHSHIDHYGGVEAVLRYPNHFDDETAKKNDIPIYVPEGFYEHAVSENVYVGNAMGRRASYQYGSFIKPEYSGPISKIDTYTIGSISIGIGQGQSTGTPSAVPSAVREIKENCCLNLDGLDIYFQLTPGTEAPAEMNNYFYDYNALWLAENCTGTLHNLYTLRGAQVRDAKAWANYLMETANLFGNKAEVIFQSHNWPHWKKAPINVTLTDGGTDIRNFLIDTAAIYKYIHDQTLLYMNMGYKMNEVSDMLTLPRAMQKNWCLKPFYGTPKHNAKAVYQKYLGWYDANPLHLEELPPEQLAKEMMRYMQAGSEEKVLEMISQDIDNGNYWTAAYMAHQMILSDSVNRDKAKKLCADAMQQLGYQCESGTWRNAYLSAAEELRNGKQPMKQSSGSLGDMPPEMLLDYMSIFFDGERAAAKLGYNGYLTVDDTKFMFVVRNGAILYYDVSQTACSSNGKEMTISKSVLYDVIKGVYPDPKKTYTEIHDILVKISQAMVNINCYRFKQFDIIGRHDSEVNFLNSDGKIEKVDLKVEVKKCITMLEPYTEKFGNKPAIYLSDDDKFEWQTYYYPLLKTEAQVILEGDFFIPRDATMGIGNDCYFMAYELYYTLYSLYRYLYSGYLKNDFDFKDDNYSKESFVKLKKSIVLLESYVADYYLSPADNSVTFDEDDSNAWRYLRSVSGQGCVSFSVKDFFAQLHKLYVEFQSEINSIILLRYSSATSLKIYNARTNGIMVNGKKVDCTYQNNIALIDISGFENTIVIESFDKCGSQNLITGRLIFHKPEILRNGLLSGKADVSLPNPFINFHTKYTSVLIIDGEVQENAEEGRTIRNQETPVIAISPIGFYIKCIMYEPDK